MAAGPVAAANRNRESREKTSSPPIDFRFIADQARLAALDTRFVARIIAR